MSDSTPLRVLVVGDWVVDENWTVTPGNPIASGERLGIYHRSSVLRGAGVHCPSGAGRVAWRVRECLMRAGKPIEIVGLGLWAERDGDVVQALVAGSDVLGNHYELAHPKSGRARLVPGVKMINLAEYLEQPTEGEFSTTRGFQIFKTQPSGDVELSLRVDWERPEAPYCAEEGAQVWQLNDEPRLELRLQREVAELDAIIVKCLGKGVLSRRLVQLLAKRFPNVPWYVSTKLGRRAGWLPIVGSKLLRLLFFSESAIREDHVTEWRLGDRCASYEAVDFLKELAKKYRALDRSRSAIVVMPKPLSLVTRHVERGSNGISRQQGVGRYGKELDDLPSRMGKASVLFGSLTAELLPADGKRSFPDILEECVRGTYTWGKAEKQRMGGNEAEGKQRRGDGAAEVGGGTHNPERKDDLPWYKVDCEPWDDNTEQWVQSRTGLGIIKCGGARSFDLWRGRSCVKGYIAISDQRRKAASALFRMIREFRDLQPEPTRSVSCVVMDAPGRGKSSLVKGVAKSLGVEFREIDLSQLTEAADLANRLDGIITDQTEVKRRFLIFVDEIDSNNGEWYGRFLAPLESGYYVRGGSRFYVKPCAWVFAGSTRTSPVQPNNLQPPGGATKLPDFKSRLTHGEMRLSKLHGGEDSKEWESQERLERVYIAVSMLRSKFPYVKRLTPGVLFAFYRLDLSVEVRRIRHLIDKITALKDDWIFTRHVYGAGGEFDSGDLLPLYLDFQQAADINDTRDDREVILRDLR